MTTHRRINLVCAVATALIFAVAWFAAHPQQPSPQPPTLSTADRVAIQTFEKSKQDAQKQFTDAQQGELTVLREWQTAHPGYHIDQNTFAITADPKPEVPKEPKKP